MNASVAFCAVMLSVLPAAEPLPSTSESIFSLGYSRQAEAVIRGQNPGPVLTTPMLTVPTAPSQPQEMTVYAPPSGPMVAQGAPGGYGPTFEPSPFGVPAPTPSQNYIYDPGYMPGGAMQEHRWGFYVGYDNVILKPYFPGNSAVTTPNDNSNFRSSTNLDWGFTYSPRVWIGLIEPNGTGMQVRYWQFDTGDESDGGHQSLDVDVIDAEKQWHFSTRHGAVSVGGGFRYASLDEKLVTNFEPGPAGKSYDRNFSGFGPTISISGRRRVNATNWSLFASGRLSGLFGTSSSAIITADPLVTANEAAIYNSGNEFIGVTDIQFGVDWSAPVFQQTHMFVRIAGEAQLWLGGGLPTDTSNSNYGNMGFFGFTVGTGLTF